MPSPRKLFWWLRCVLVGLWIVITLWLLPTMPRINESSKLLLECRGNPNCIASQTMAIGGSIRAASGQIAKAAPEITKSFKDMASKSAEASGETVKITKQAQVVVGHLDDVVQNANGLISDVRSDLKNLDGLTQDLRRNLDPLMRHSDESVQQLTANLQELERLEKLAYKQIDEGSLEVLKTMTALRKLAESPEWLQTLQHLEKGAGSGEEILKTIDISTRSLRKIQGQIRLIMSKIAQAVKFTISPW